MSPGGFSKTNIAFVKYGGLAAGGTEKFLQEIAIELVRLGFQIDYFYCDPKMSPGSAWIHPPNDKLIETRLLRAGVKLIKFEVGYKDLSKNEHTWVSSNFFEIFNERKYDMVWTAKAGPKEYPFHLINLPFVEVVTLDSGFDNSQNRIYSILISNWQRNSWIQRGGNERSSSILPLPVADNGNFGDYRSEFDISENNIVIGFHQRVDNAIVSPIPLEAFAAVSDSRTIFLIMGGGTKYRELAEDLRIPTLFLPHDSNQDTISRFLNTLDIYAHGRSDGETFGTVLAEAMTHGLPIVTHKSTYGANAHSETIANGGFFTFSQSEYCNVLGELVSNADLRFEVGERGREFANLAYSQSAFKTNLHKILNNIGLLGSPEKAKNRSSTKTIAARVVPGTRVLIHDLPESKIYQANLLAKRTEIFTSLIVDLKLCNPQTIQTRSFETLLISINVARGMTKAKIFHHSNNIEDIESSKILLNINGVTECEVAKENTLYSSQRRDEIKLSFCGTPFDAAFTFQQRGLGFDKGRNLRKFRLLLFAPIESVGKVRMERLNVAVECRCFNARLMQIMIFTRNIAFIFKSIIKIYASRIKRRKFYLRLLHLKFLILRAHLVKR